MENDIKVSPSHILLKELTTAVFNCDIEAVEAALKKGAKPTFHIIIKAGHRSYGLAEHSMNQKQLNCFWTMLPK